MATLATSESPLPLPPAAASKKESTPRDPVSVCVCFFASASSTTGLGHIVRCQSLARILSAAGVHIRWCSRRGPDSEAMLCRGLGRVLNPDQGDLFLEEEEGGGGGRRRNV